MVKNAKSLFWPDDFTVVQGYYTGYPKDLWPSRVINFTSERQFVQLLHEGRSVVVAFTIRCTYTKHLDKVLEEAAAEFYLHIKFMRSPQKVSSLSVRAAGHPPLGPRLKETPRSATVKISPDKHSPLGPRLKETPRSATVKISPDKHSGLLQFQEFSKESELSCDICRRPEMLLNQIFVCSSCKVAVHLDCYRKLNDPIGPRKCELCEEMSQSGSSRSQTVENRERFCLVVECGLCGGGYGAFRKATNGQWVHAFCAEWLLESRFRRGQQNLADGMKNSRGMIKEIGRTF